MFYVLFSLPTFQFILVFIFIFLFQRIRSIFILFSLDIWNLIIELYEMKMKMLVTNLDL